MRGRMEENYTEGDMSLRGGGIYCMTSVKMSYFKNVMAWKQSGCLRES